jgi:hypothetical protein
MRDLVGHLKMDKLTIALPTNLWDTMDEEILNLCQTEEWHTFRFLLPNGELNSDIELVDNSKGGIYIFYISPEIIPQRQRILMYVGRAQITQYENLRQRIRSYYTLFHGGDCWKRQRIQDMFNCWEKYLYCSYIELTNNDLIIKTEAELINKLLPYCNSAIPDQTIGRAARAAGL